MWVGGTCNVGIVGVVVEHVKLTRYTNELASGGPTVRFHGILFVFSWTLFSMACTKGLESCKIEGGVPTL